MTQPGQPNFGNRRMSLRTRVTALAAVCVGSAVALVSLAGYFTVRTSLYGQLDTQLLQRADSLRDTLANAEQQLGVIPPGVFSAADIRVGLLDGRTGERAAFGGALEMGPDELAVAQGRRLQSLRTDQARDLRVAAVPALPGTALVVA
ncbi:MAG: two-component sensor histidine kinase, partial [Pseudonocardiaceae bacterium]